MSTIEVESQRPPWILPVIVLSQFAGTSLWFAGNAVLPELQREWNLPAASLGYITSAVQLGFICGTLVFAFFAISDRISPRIVFFACSLLGGLSGLAIFAVAPHFTGLLVVRFVAGFFLAGIYPVGMKIAAGWYQRGLGSAIGFLVGALVLGTAFPHLLKGFGHAVSWEAVTLGVCATAVLGGLAMLWFVPDGPYLAQGTRFDPRALALVFRSRDFRASAFGYFGHMWELYAFWAFVPFALAAHSARTLPSELNVPFWSFCIIAAGFVGCAAGGRISLKTGSARVAFVQLCASGLCCVVSPMFFHAPTPLFLAFLLFWGVVVVGDSPQFSTLNAQNAPRALVGSALTIANCVGFAISILSIELLNALAAEVSAAYLFLPLTFGPILGLIAMRPLLRPFRALDGVTR
jgi:predicted MFS family arabinose efflux permease